MIDDDELELKIVKNSATRKEIGFTILWRILEGIANVFIAIISIIVGILSAIAGLFGSKH